MHIKNLADYNEIQFNNKTIINMQLSVMTLHRSPQIIDEHSCKGIKLYKKVNYRIELN